MNQKEFWSSRWKEIMDFMEEKKRRPSKFIHEEMRMGNRWKHQQKLMNAGALKLDRFELFKRLLEEGGEVQTCKSVSIAGGRRRRGLAPLNGGFFAWDVGSAADSYAAPIAK